MNCVRVLGLEVLCPYDASDLADFVFENWNESGHGGVLVALNAEKLIKAAESEKTRSLLAQSRWVYPDGVGAVLAIKRECFGVDVRKVAGADLWRLMVLRAEQKKIPVGIVGGTAEVLTATVQKLGDEFPELNIAFAMDGFTDIEDVETLNDAVAKSGKTLTLLALGSPKQEKIAFELLRWNPQSLFMGVGGSFDVYTGKVSRAPEFMQRFGLEWFYRLVMQPSRWRRYLRLYKLFLILWKKNK